MYDNLQQFGPPGNMGMDGLAGKWIKLHPQYNGPNELLVRDSVIDGQDMVVITDQGNISMTEFSNNYYRESDEEYNMDGSVKTSSSSSIQSSVQLPVNNNIDYNVLTAGMGDNPNTSSFNPNTVQDTVSINDYIPDDVKVQAPQSSTLDIKLKNQNTDAIKKVFSKLETSPCIDLSLSWDEFPKTEIQMLIKYFDVAIDDIASYIVQNHITKEIINNAVKTKLNEYIS